MRSTSREIRRTHPRLQWGYVRIAQFRPGPNRHFHDNLEQKMGKHEVLSNPTRTNVRDGDR
jgi:hypothetical protein